MTRYFYWVGGGVLGALLGVAFGSRAGYMGGLWVGDTVYHHLAGRHDKYVKAT